MPRSKIITVPFPALGVNNALGYESQPPGTTASALNVRARGPSQGRTRGGARSGLAKAFVTQIGSGNPVRLLGSVRSATASASFVEPFNGSSLSSGWVKLSGSTPTVTSGYATIPGSATAFYERTAFSTFDDTATYSLEIDVFQGKGLTYTLRWMGDGASTSVGFYAAIALDANYITNGNWIISVLESNGSTVTSVSGTDASHAGGGTGTLRVVIAPGGTGTVYWKGTSRTTFACAAAGANKRVGFYIQSSVTAWATLYEFRFTYVASTTETREILVAGCNGKWYYENGSGGLTEVSSSLSTTRHVPCADFLGKLYAPNYGTPRYFQPSDNTNQTWSASPGSFPSSCYLICQWNGRLVLSDGTAAWYMTRIGSATDFDFSVSINDSGRAFASTSSTNAQLGQNIRALIPFNNDYLIFGMTDSIAMLAGDPGLGGTFVTLSQTIGVTDMDAWCITPSNEVVFLSRYGVYVITPGVSPQPLSQTVIPRELQNIDPASYFVSMEFDTRDYGVHLFLNPLLGGNAQHWFIDWTNKAFFPQEYPTTQLPSSIYAYDSLSTSGSKVLLGGQDGYIRRHADGQITDDGTAVSSSVTLGPMLLGTPHMLTGELASLAAVLPTDHSVSWAVHVSDTAQGVYERIAMGSTPAMSGTFSASNSASLRPPLSLRGIWAGIVLSSTGAWELDTLLAEVRPGGRWRP
jgi:hypothetical protein